MRVLLLLGMGYLLLLIALRLLVVLHCCWSFRAIEEQLLVSSSSSDIHVIGIAHQPGVRQ
jgi:hypothetical protein